MKPHRLQRSRAVSCHVSTTHHKYYLYIILVYEYYEGPTITYSYSLAISLRVLIDCTNSFVFVRLKRLVDSCTNIQLVNTYSYILLYLVQRFCISFFYRQNSTCFVLLIKQIGIPTYHNSSRVNTRDKCS